LILISQGHDLPQLYTRPSADDILKTLRFLEIKPRSWNVNNQMSGSENTVALSVDSKGVSHYLTSIIASPLAWIKDEATRERVWEEASARLSERSGRTAMKSFDRTFDIPTRDGPMQLLIHEPGLTADNLGLKTWAASYVLAKRFCSLSMPSSLSITPTVALELGSGTGLVGMAAAAVLGIAVCLTDLPDITGNLKRNVESNLTAIQSRGGDVSVTVLDWSRPSSLQLPVYATSMHGTSGGEERNTPFSLILAADTIYSMDHPKLLVNVIKYWLAKTADARVIFELPRRLGYERELEFLREELEAAGLAMIDQEEDIGYDDWGISQNGGTVQCWYSMWAWKF
jgi:predicted nicotinamide N-methyase